MDFQIDEEGDNKSLSKTSLQKTSSLLNPNQILLQQIEGGDNNNNSSSGQIENILGDKEIIKKVSEKDFFTKDYDGVSNGDVLDKLKNKTSDMTDILKDIKSLNSEQMVEEMEAMESGEASLITNKHNNN